MFHTTIPIMYLLHGCGIGDCAGDRRSARQVLNIKRAGFLCNRAMTGSCRCHLDNSSKIAYLGRDMGKIAQKICPQSLFGMSKLMETLPLFGRSLPGSSWAILSVALKHIHSMLERNKKSGFV